MIPKSVIIVAGGSGKRMGSDLPKQFLEVAGKPVLMHTIETFFRYDQAISIVLVLPKSQHEYWNGLVEKYKFSIAHKVAKGGVERFFSVKNGLEYVDSGIVAVHDGVRPLVSLNTIATCFTECEKLQAVVPVIPANESIRKIKDGSSRAVNRRHYFMVQTPQVFDVHLLKEAYNQEYDCAFTDDASVVEKLGCKITTIEGNPENIKITRPMDLKIAEVLLK